MAEASKTIPPAPLPAGVGSKDSLKTKDASPQPAGKGYIDPTDPEAMDAWLKQGTQVAQCLK